MEQHAQEAPRPRAAVHPDDVFRSLPVPLTEYERAKLGDAMGACEVRIEALQERRAKIGATVKEVAAERNRLGKILDAGVENRKVACRWIEDRAHLCKSLVRQDTGEVVEERTLSGEDLQEGIAFDGPGEDDQDDDDQDDEDDLAAASSAEPKDAGEEETIDLDDDDAEDDLDEDELEQDDDGEAETEAERETDPEPAARPASQPNA